MPDDTLNADASNAQEPRAATPAARPQDTRRRIADILKRGGPRSASELAAELGVTAMAVRQHLYAMAESGMVGVETRAQAVGRPTKIWHLTEAAESFFPDGHADLAVGLIDSLKRALGETAMDKLVADRADQQVAQYRARVTAHADLAARLAELARIRSEEGYMAEVARDPSDGALMLVENHCPICQAARACSGLCAMELEVFRRTLGDGVRVERTDHILAGARRCAYRVVPRETDATQN